MAISSTAFRIAGSYYAKKWGDVVSRVSKKEYAYENIKQLILNGDLMTGEIYSEQNLADMLSQHDEISRTPVREALQLLAKEGVVKIKPQKGISITVDISDKELADMFEMRIALETHVIRKIMPTLEMKNIEVMKDYIARQDMSVSQGKRLDFLKLDYEMHMYMIHLCSNEWMKDFFAQLKRRFFWIGARAFVATGRSYFEILNEHIGYVDALEKKDLQGALDCITLHYGAGISSYQRLCAKAVSNRRAREVKEAME